MMRVAVVAVLSLVLFGAALGVPRAVPAAWAQEYADGDEINLAVGETRTISARNVKNYSEGVAGIVAIKLTTDASQFVINGRQPGTTTLLLIKNDGSQVTLNINVFQRSPELVEKELTQLLKGLSVKPRRVGAQIVLDGTVANNADLQRVAQVAAMYPDQVTSLVQLDDGSGVVVGPSGAAQRYLIRIDFYFVQYDKNSSYGVGIGYPASYGGQNVQLDYSYDFLAGTTRAATATLSGQPLPQLDLAATKGWAKVLKHATVITNNDIEAKFMSGGEQNFSVNTGLTIGVQSIDFGTTVTVLPHYDPGTREINVKLDAEVAELTASVGSTTLPGRSRSTLTTSVSLKLGQSIVLSGIRSESLRHSVSGLPVLSQIPVLGLLFGSHSQSKLQTEGAIFVVPTVVEKVPASAAELVDIALKQFEDYDGDLDDVAPFDERPGGSVGVPKVGK